MTVTKTDLVSQQQHALKKYSTKVINLIGGPSTGKSVMAAVIFVHLKLAGKTAESVPEFAKSLVWQKDFEALKNQYLLSQKQYEMLKMLDGELQYIITDGPLIQQLYYNKHYENNICNIEKTHKQILSWYNEFENINIFLERNPTVLYEQAGRYQKENQAKSIDPVLEQMLIDEGVKYFKVKSDITVMNEFVKHTILTS